MSFMEIFNSDDYSDGITKQGFKDETDINRLLGRAASGQTISHISRYGPMYGDFSDIDDLLTANQRLSKAREIFEELPGEVRREFDQDVGKFFNFVTSVTDQEELLRVMPALAKQGDQFPELRRTREGVEARENVPATPTPPEPETPPSE